MNANSAPLPFSIAGFDQNSGDCTGSKATFEDTYLVIGQFKLIESRIDALETFSKGIIDGIDRTISRSIGFDSLALEWMTTVARDVTVPSGF